MSTSTLWQGVDCNRVFRDVDCSLDLLIRTQQRDVHNRQYHSSACRDPSHPKTHVYESASITCLQLCLQALSDCDRAGVLIYLAEGVKSVESLAIAFEGHFHFNFYVLCCYQDQSGNRPQAEPLTASAPRPSNGDHSLLFTTQIQTRTHHTLSICTSRPISRQSHHRTPYQQPLVPL